MRGRPVLRHRRGPQRVRLQRPRRGSGDVFVAEADESDRSFLLLAPFAGIVTNVEADHLDNYGDLAAVEAAFDRFVGTVDPAGFVVLCADDPGSARLREVPTGGARVVTYGFTDGGGPAAARPGRRTRRAPAGRRCTTAWSWGG